MSGNRTVSAERWLHLQAPQAEDAARGAGHGRIENPHLYLAVRGGAVRAIAMARSLGSGAGFGGHAL